MSHVYLILIKSFHQKTCLKPLRLHKYLSLLSPSEMLVRLSSLWSSNWGQLCFRNRLFWWYLWVANIWWSHGALWEFNKSQEDRHILEKCTRTKFGMLFHGLNGLPFVVFTGVCEHRTLYSQRRDWQDGFSKAKLRRIRLSRSKENF